MIQVCKPLLRSRLFCLPGSLFTGLLSGLVLASAFSGTALEAAGTERPNIVFIHADDHRHDLFGFAGHPFVETPQLDSLAAEGLHFPNAFTVSGTCAPARAAFWTGRYPHRASAPYITHQNNSFLLTQTTFSERLQSVGYQTAHVGKWHLGLDEEKPRGFDTWYGWENGGTIFDQVFIKNGTERIETTGFADDANAEIAVSEIKAMAQDRDHPFFLSVGFRSPHRPFAYPERLEDFYAEADIPKPETFDINYAASGRDPYIQRVSDIHVSNSPFYKGFRGWENYIKSHYRAAYSLDENVGKILKALDAAGIDDNTIVIYTSDHGYNLGEFGLVEKHYPYEQVMRVPLIVRWPDRIPAGIAPEAMVSHLDMAPSLLEWVGAPLPEGLDGRSWTPLVRAPEAVPADWRDAVFYNYESRNGRIPGMNTLRTERYKYILSDRGHVELYDIQNDPLEKQSLATDPAHADTLAEMAARYRAYTESIGYRPRPTRSLLNEVHVLRDVSEAQALALSEYYTDRAFDPAETVELSGRTFRWEAIQAGAKGAFPTEALQSQGDRLTLLAMDVKRLTDYDPHLALWIAPWPETTLYWQGQAIWSYYRKAGNLCNPPLAAPENTVLIGLREVNRPVTIHFEGMRDALEVNGRRP